MTELEQTLLKALRQQAAALDALNERAERQQQQIDQLAESVRQLGGSVHNVIESFSGVESQLSKLGRR